MVVFSAICHAQNVDRHVVVITGAGSLEKFLNDNLEIRLHETDATITPEEWQRLVGITPQKIGDLLATQGYFSPTVNFDVAKETDGSVVRFDVTPGPVTQIISVTIQFTGAIAAGPHADPERIENLKSDWRLPPGEPFKQNEWTDAKQALLKGLLARDYPTAKIVESEAQINPEQRTAALTVEVDSGPFFTFGTIEITGLERYPRKVIDAVNPIRQGEPYSQSKLTELQTRLQDTGYFRSIFATIDADPAHPDMVPVHLTLNENERRRLSVGTGYSTDTGARGQLKWLDREFLGRNWRMESELRVDRQSSLIGTDIYFPTRDNGWRPSLGTHYERTDIANEIDDKIRVDARLTGPIKVDERSWGVSYLADRQRLGGDAINNRQALVATFSHIRRRVDNVLLPERGYVASIDLAAGITGSITEKNVGRVVARGYTLIPLGQKWLTVFRGEIGDVLGAKRDVVPGDLLFRTGGDQSVRGYPFNSLGVPVVQNGSESIVGGTVTAVVSAELVYKITPTWGAAIFRDAGDAADSWAHFKFKQGTGIGARWRSPIGPVNLDLAYGHSVNQVRLHFSVGYGF